MFIHSDDYLNFNSPLIIKEINVCKKKFFGKYFCIELEKIITVVSPQCGRIETNKLILEQRFPFNLLGSKRYPIEILILTPNYYDKGTNICKCVLAIGYLYDGLPEYENNRYT